MSRSQSENAAERAWTALSPKRQMSIARQLAASRHKRLRSRYPNILSVGAGFRTKGLNKKLLREVCVRFLVSTKWSRPRKGAVPRHLFTVVEIRGVKRRCAVPTDVIQLGRQRANASNDLGDGVAVHPAGGPAVGGAVCALVKDRDDPESFYLLGCHHVMTGSLDNGGCAPTFACSVSRADDNRPIGPTVGWSDLTPATGFSLDAAIVKVHDKHAVSSEIHGMEPQRVAAEGVHSGTAGIYSPRGVLLAEFAGEWWHADLEYQCGANVTVERVYEYKAATEPGDSGSPVLDADGVLYGMHFYETDEGVALAIPAYKLFQPSLFGKKLALVKGHAG